MVRGEKMKQCAPRFVRVFLRPMLPTLPSNEKGEQYFALFTDQTYETIGFSNLFSFQIRVTHNDHVNRYVLYIGIRFRYGESFRIKNQVLDRWGSLFQGN